MSSANVSIEEAPGSSTVRLYYSLLLTYGGKPLAGREIVVQLEGDGSLAPTFSSKQVMRQTDAEGRAMVTWYRRSIFGRVVRARLTASIDEECAIRLQPMAPEEVEALLAGPSITYVPPPPFRLRT